MDRTLKIPELREQYEPSEVNVLQLQRPRSGTHIFAPGEYNKRYTRNYGPSVSVEDVLWSMPVNTRLTWLTGTQGYASLLVKNVEAWFEVL